MEHGCGPHANCSDKRLPGGGAGKLTLHPAPPGRGTHTHSHTEQRQEDLGGAEETGCRWECTVPNRMRKSHGSLQMLELKKAT